MTRTSSPKDADRRPLHAATQGCDGDLRRRVGAGDPPHLPTRTGAGHPTGVASKPSSTTAVVRTWVYGGLRVRDGQQVTMTASSRNNVFYQQLMAERLPQLVAAAGPFCLERVDFAFPWHAAAGVGPVGAGSRRIRRRPVDSHISSTIWRLSAQQGSRRVGVELLHLPQFSEFR